MLYRTGIRMTLLSSLSSLILCLAFTATGDEHAMETPSAGQQELIIIGIHGLLNKPPPGVLETGWQDAIVEGLDRNYSLTQAIPFKLVYWADVRNSTPIADNDEPYVKAEEEGPLETYNPGSLDKARAIANKYVGRWADIEKQLFGLGTNIEHLIGIKFDDLADYYEKPEIRQQMRSKLSEILEQNQGKRVLLIAHSMGSIIAYDVLRTYDGSDALRIEHFVTIGSPLGLPIVGQKVRKEFGKPQTPTVVQRWTNIADPGDKVALDCALADEYTSTGPVQVKDVLANNGYVSPGDKPNNHKSYGYLRAPEVSEVIRDFLAQKE